MTSYKEKFGACRHKFLSFSLFFLSEHLVYIYHYLSRSSVIRLLSLTIQRRPGQTADTFQVADFLPLTFPHFSVLPSLLALCHPSVFRMFSLSSSRLSCEFVALLSCRYLWFFVFFFCFLFLYLFLFLQTNTCFDLLIKENIKMVHQCSIITNLFQAI